MGASAASQGEQLPGAAWRRDFAPVPSSEHLPQSVSDQARATGAGGFRFGRVAVVAGIATVALVAAVVVNKWGQDSSATRQQFRAEATQQQFRAEKRRLGSFFVIGDWGWDKIKHKLPERTCQKAIASEMLDKMEELGDVKFVVNVGDSFYPAGVTGKDDPQWDEKWRDVYDLSLRSIPWYSVYGNHDYRHDPCACSSDPKACAQMNWNITDLDYFFMPGFSWYREHPELDLEVIGMDLNHYKNAWNRSIPADELWFSDCVHSQCQDTCPGLIDERSKQAFELFDKRFQESSAKNLVVFSHYPTDYFSTKPDFVKMLSSTSHKILYLGGHRHNVDNTSTDPTTPNENWVVGGGGGYSCDGPSQGFLSVTIDEDYNMQTSMVTVPYETCCRSPEPVPPLPKRTATSFASSDDLAA